MGITNCRIHLTTKRNLYSRWKDFYGERKKLLDTCIIIFSKEIYETVLSTYDCAKITEINAPNGAVPIYKFSFEGKEIAFYLSAIGSTGTSEYCIEANWLTGAKKFIMFGSAGSLNKEKTDGNIELTLITCTLDSEKRIIIKAIKEW